MDPRISHSGMQGFQHIQRLLYIRVDSLVIYQYSWEDKSMPRVHLQPYIESWVHTVKVYKGCHLAQQQVVLEIKELQKGSTQN